MHLPHVSLEYEALQEALEQPTDDSTLFKMIVNTPFAYRLQMLQMFLGIIVLLLVDKKTSEIHRVALSDTELAKNTTDVSVVPFEEIKIDVTHPTNAIAKAINTGEPQSVSDWKHLFEPALTPTQARINQASAGIACSYVYPLKARNGGAMIFSYYQYGSDLGDMQQQFMEQYVTLVDDVLSKS
jgi:hypothetical protein